MAANGRGSLRPNPGGKTPPFLIVGLLVVIGILAFNYWNLTSKNTALSEEIQVLQGKYSAVEASKRDADKLAQKLTGENDGLHQQHRNCQEQMDDKAKESGKAIDELNDKLDNLAEELESTKNEFNACDDQLSLCQQNVSSTSLSHKRQIDEIMARCRNDIDAEKSMAEKHAADVEESCKAIVNERRLAVLRGVQHVFGTKALVVLHEQAQLDISGIDMTLQTNTEQAQQLAILQAGAQPQQSLQQQQQPQQQQQLLPQQQQQFNQQQQQLGMAPQQGTLQRQQPQMGIDNPAQQQAQQIAQQQQAVVPDPNQAGQEQVSQQVVGQQPQGVSQETVQDTQGDVLAGQDQGEQAPNNNIQPPEINNALHQMPGQQGVYPQQSFVGQQSFTGQRPLAGSPQNTGGQNAYHEHLAASYQEHQSQQAQNEIPPLQSNMIQDTQRQDTAQQHEQNPGYQSLNQGPGMAIAAPDANNVPYQPAQNVANIDPNQPQGQEAGHEQNMVVAAPGDNEVHAQYVQGDDQMDNEDQDPNETDDVDGGEQIYNDEHEILVQEVDTGAAAPAGDTNVIDPQGLSADQEADQQHYINSQNDAEQVDHLQHVHVQQPVVPQVRAPEAQVGVKALPGANR